MSITWTTTTTMAIVSQLPDWIETWDFCEDINCINDHNDDEDNDNNNNDDKNNRKNDNVKGKSQGLNRT